MANAGMPAIARGLNSGVALLRESTGSGRRKRSNPDGADTEFRPPPACAPDPPGVRCCRRQASTCPVPHALQRTTTISVRSRIVNPQI